MWMPSRRARTAAGSSVASWNNAVERACPGRRPSWRSRSPSLSALTGRPGCPPGNSQLEVPGSPRTAWPRRVTASSPGEGGQRLGQHHGHRPEAEPDRAVAGVEVVEGEAADRRGPLGVKQYQQPCDAVAGAEGIVVQQPPGLLTAPVLIKRPGGTGPPGGGELQVAVDAAGDRPADEVTGFGFAGCVRADQPCVQVGLGAAGQGEPALAQPAEQADSGTHPLPDRVELAIGGGCAAVALPQPPQQVPGRVAVQQFLVVRAGVLADGLADPALDPGELLVAGRQRSGSDQDTAQVLDGLAGREIIKRGVAERALPGGELGEHRAGGGTLEPVQHGVGPSGAGQGVVQHPQFRADLPAGVGEELAELAAQLAAAADPGQQAPAGATGRAGLPETLIRHRAAGAQRRLAGAGPDGGQLPAARAFRLPAGARPAPRLTGGLGHHAGGGPPAHAAGRDRPGDARRADRPFRQARADAAPPSAAGAFFQVDRVADQAVRA